jgi:hypothetical protein
VKRVRRNAVSFQLLVLDKCWPGERGNLKLDESCISNSETRNLKLDWPVCARVQSEISSFEFEMQDSSNFKFSLSLPEVGGEAPSR